MEVTEAGSVTEVSCLQLENALFPMDVSEEGSRTCVIPSHPLNALAPIAVTPSGIETLASFRLFWKAV